MVNKNISRDLVIILIIIVIAFGILHTITEPEIPIPEYRDYNIISIEITILNMREEMEIINIDLTNLTYSELQIKLIEIDERYEIQRAELELEASQIQTLSDYIDEEREYIKKDYAHDMYWLWSGTFTLIVALLVYVYTDESCRTEGV